jgi:hypothetical protein
MKKILKKPFWLKIIAIITMVIDHTGAILFPHLLFLRVIGRISFPIFGYLLASGIDTTRNKMHYGIRLGLFAIIAQPFYHYAFQPQTTSLNIFFTLFIAYSIITLFIHKKIATHYRVFISLFLLVSSFLLPINYGISGVLSIIAWYFFKEKPVQNTIIQSLISLWYCIFFTVLSGKPLISVQTISITVQILSIISIPLIYGMMRKSYHESFWMIPNKTAKIIQYGFYLFYPLHLFILFFIKKSLF